MCWGEYSAYRVTHNNVLKTFYIFRQIIGFTAIAILCQLKLNYIIRCEFIAKEEVVLPGIYVW